MSDDLLPPPDTEVKPHSMTEALALPTGAKQLTLWGDVWRKLKRDKRFYVAAFLIAIFVLMAIAPFLFLTKDPNACPISFFTPAASATIPASIGKCAYPYATSATRARRPGSAIASSACSARSSSPPKYAQ